MHGRAGVLSIFFTSAYSRNPFRHEPAYILQDDLPEKPSDDEFELDFETKNLELTEHQKAMLLPPEIRIRNPVMPGSIRARVQCQQVARRKSRWSAKFTGIFVGRLARKWKRTVSKLGRAAGLAELARSAGPTTNLKPSLVGVRGRPNASTLTLSSCGFALHLAALPLRTMEACFSVQGTRIAFIGALETAEIFPLA